MTDYRTVPVEPTREMLQAGAEAMWQGPAPYGVSSDINGGK